MSAVISGLIRFTAEKDYKNAAGQTVIAAGETVILVPQTLASSVILANGQTLEQAFHTLESGLAGHAHADYEAALAGYQTQLVQVVNRLTGAGF